MDPQIQPFAMFAEFNSLMNFSEKSPPKVFVSLFFDDNNLIVNK